MAATMHAKMNRKKLNKLNIIRICEEILNPSVPMALRLSGILMGGVVIVYERKVKLLYDDVTRLLVEINEAWKVKATTADPTLLPKGKSHAKREAVTLPEKVADIGDIEQSLHLSSNTVTMGFQRSAYFTMRLDTIDEPYLNNTAEEDTCHHQVDADSITLIERFESFQTNGNMYNQFERFDVEGDEETQPNFTSKENTQWASTFMPSPPAQDEPSRADKNQGEYPEVPVTKQSDENMDGRQYQVRYNVTKRKRRQQVVPALDYKQTIIPGHTYQSWLQNSSNIVSRRGKRRKRVDVISTTKIANLMELPPVVLMGNLFTSGNREIYYPPPLLKLWMKSTQPPQDSPSERISTMLPPEPSSSSPPVNYVDLMGLPFEDGRSGVGSESFIPSLEKQRAASNYHNSKHVADELGISIMKNELRAPELHQVTPRHSGCNVNFTPSSVSEHGSAAHNREVDSGRSNKKRPSSSRNSSGGLEPVAEENSWQQQSAPNFKLARLSETGLTPDHELLVETGPTQTQNLINNHPVDQMTDSIKAQMKAYFDTPGVPPSESLDLLAAGLTRSKAALLFYQTCVLASKDAVRVEQKLPYGEILISRGAKMF